MKTLLKKAASYFFTYRCPGCDSHEFDFSNELFCMDCMRKLCCIHPPFCDGCGAELDGVLNLCSKCLVGEPRPWKNAVSIFHMDGLGSDLIHRFKYNGDFELGGPLSALAEMVLRSRGLNVDVVVPVPLHWRRLFMRGYNQSEVIAKGLANRLGVPMERMLKRNRYTKQQANLDKAEREKNLIGAFSLIKGANCKKRSILLVDDVMTTGSTLTEAAKVLLNGVDCEVSILVLARR